MSGKSEKPRRKPKLTRARLAVLASLLACAVGLVIAVQSSRSTYRVEAVFTSVNGLVEGAPVKVAGLSVGKVASIELADDGFPHVELELTSDLELHEGASANLRAGSASGQVNRFIVLAPGAEDGRALDDGTTLGLARTDEPIEVERVLSTLDPATRADIRGTLDGLARATDGHVADLRASLANSSAALGNTADLLGQISADGEALRGVIIDGRAVVEELAGNRDALAASAQSTGSLLMRTAARERELATTADLLPETLETAEGALVSLDDEVPDLRELVAQARPGVAALVPFTRALRPALTAARPALAEGSRLVADADGQIAKLDPLLSDAEPTLTTLESALTEAGPILDEARVRTPDFFSFFANWADFTGVYDANGHAARVGLVLPPAPNNLIDGSDSGAGSLAAPFVRTPGVLEGEPWLDFRDSFLSGGGG